MGGRDFLSSSQGSNQSAASFPGVRSSFIFRFSAFTPHIYHMLICRVAAAQCAIATQGMYPAKSFEITDHKNRQQVPRLWLPSWSSTGTPAHLVGEAASHCGLTLSGRSAQLHRRRIYTEEKAKVVGAVWGTEFIQSLAALAILHQDDLKNGMNSSFSSNCLGAINPFLHIILVQTS